MSSHLIEIRKIMDKCLVCDIQVQDIFLSATGLKVKTNKWLHLEDWLEIDSTIEKILDPYCKSETLDGFDTNIFHLGAIRVNCTKLKLSKAFKKILGEEKTYLPIALNIQVTKTNTKDLMDQIKNYEEKLKEFNKKVNVSSNNETAKVTTRGEYDPTAHKTSTNRDSGEYVPYTASVKTPSAIDTSGTASEPYSPKPICLDESSADQISESPNQIPNYKPARIAHANQKTQNSTENNNEKPKEDKSKSLRRRHSPESKTKSKSSSRSSSSHKHVSKRTASAPPQNPASEMTELFGTEESDTEETKTPRKTSTKSTSSSKTTSSPKHASSTTSTKTAQSPKRALTPLRTPDETQKHDSKRKRLKLGDDSSQKSMRVWLSKSTSHKIAEKSTDKTNGKSSKKSSRHESKSELPKKVAVDLRQQEKELELKQIRELHALRDTIKAQRKSPPPQMEILSLTHLSSEEILGTFDIVKPVLDPIFKVYSKKSKVTGFDGINHMKTLMLIDDKKQLQMMNFLRENYQPEEKGVPSLTDLYINALVPEWTVNVFMKEFKFTRSEALKRLQDQEDCTVHHHSDEMLDSSAPLI